MIEVMHSNDANNVGIHFKLFNGFNDSIFFYLLLGIGLLDTLYFIDGLYNVQKYLPKTKIFNNLVIWAAP
jgi:hypothetical protein